MKEMGDMVLIADAFNSCKVIIAMPEGGYIRYLSYSRCKLRSFACRDFDHREIFITLELRPSFLRPAKESIRTQLDMCI